MVHAARALGLGCMLGCMVESGLGISAGAQVASLFDHVDLDGNLLLRHDPWPGRPVRRRRPVPRGGARPRRLRRVSATRYLILAEGFSGDPHYGKTMRGVLRYRRDDVVAILDSSRGRGARGRDPGRGERRATRSASARRPRSSASRRRAGASRRPGSSCSRAASRPGLDVENGLHVFLGTTRSSPRSRRGTASSCATSADRPRDLSTATGANLDGARDDRPHGRLGLRDREDDRRARARPRGAPPRPALRLRPDRSDRDRDRRAGGSRSTPSSRTSSPAPPRRSSSRATSAGETCSGSRARARSCTRSTPASRSASTTAASPHLLVLCHEPGRDEIEGAGGGPHPIPPLRELVELHERLALPARPARVAAIALNTRRLGEEEARAAIAAAERDTGLPGGRSGALRRRAARRRGARGGSGRAPGRRTGESAERSLGIGRLRPMRGHCPTGRKRAHGEEGSCRGCCRRPRCRRVAGAGAARPAGAAATAGHAKASAATLLAADAAQLGRRGRRVEVRGRRRQRGSTARWAVRTSRENRWTADLGSRRTRPRSRSCRSCERAAPTAQAAGHPRRARPLRPTDPKSHDPAPSATGQRLVATTVAAMGHPRLHRLERAERPALLAAAEGRQRPRPRRPRLRGAAGGLLRLAPRCRPAART